MAKATKQRKLLAVDTGILEALYEFSRQSGKRFDDLFDEALRDLMKKHCRPISLQEALEQSARSLAANDEEPPKKMPKKKRPKSRPRR
jgi:hypothetical protein